MSDKKAVALALGMDVGGSKIHAALYAIQHAGGDSVSTGKVAPVSCWECHQPARKGKEPHILQVAAVIEKACSIAQESGGSLLVAGIASPGRFTAGGAIRPGTNSHLETIAGEFDGAMLEDLYRQALSVSLPLKVMNDAQAMLAAMLIRQSEKDTHWIGRQVGLLGIGTGLGHAIARIGGDGGFTFITDGHASKCRLVIDAQDIARYRAVPELIWCDSQTLRAEDAVRGPVIAALAGIQDSRTLDLSHPLHASALQLAAKYLARLIAMIARAEVRDMDPAQEWSEAEKQQAAQTSHYLLGGGVGSGRLGPELAAMMRMYLERMGLESIHVHATPGGCDTPHAAVLLAMQPGL